MARKPKPNGAASKDPATENFLQGLRLVKSHPLFSSLADHVTIYRTGNYIENVCPAQGHAVLYGSEIHVHPERKASPDVWAYVIAHCILHLAFGHVYQAKSREWNAACCAYVYKFLRDLKFGSVPESMSGRSDPPGQTEQAIYQNFCDQGMKGFDRLGTAGENCADMVDNPHRSQFNFVDWEELFAEGLLLAVKKSVDVAGGLVASPTSESAGLSIAQQAKSWFISSYPLLGALAASFTIVEDVTVCQSLQVTVAAVCPQMKEIYVNPAARLNLPQMRFVMAHELLHVGLQHESRRQGRDPYLWNVACDYVINGWLVEMHVGELPPYGALYDATLRGMSAEEIYLLTTQDLRRFRKVATLRGTGQVDVLERHCDWWQRPDGVSLDEFYKRALAEGLEYHEQTGRGLLPAGLVEQIRALSQAPIPWDVELAHWFDNYFAPLEMRRTYARPSRRQSSTPDIPRPRYLRLENEHDGRTFAVLLDTSGSMDRVTLAKALGAIASYATSRDVPFLRLIFCDAAPYDQGYIAPEDLVTRTVQIKGRGGTILQHGIDLLTQAKNFPDKGPVLIITDGKCDHISVKRDHAFLLPQHHHLPFMPKGKVFYIR